MISCIPLMVMTGMMWFPDCWETLCCKIWPIQNRPCTGSYYYASRSLYQGFYHLLMFIVLLSTRCVGLGCCGLTDGSPEVHRDQGEKHFLLTRSGADCWGHCCQSVYRWIRKQCSTRETVCCASVISTWNAKHEKTIFGFLCFTLVVDSLNKSFAYVSYKIITQSFILKVFSMCVFFCFGHSALTLFGFSELFVYVHVVPHPFCVSTKRCFVAFCVSMLPLGFYLFCLISKTVFDYFFWNLFYSLKAVHI